MFQALQGTDVIVPTVLGVHPEHQAMLTELVQGDAWFSRITDPDEAVRTAQHFIEQLAALHRLDARALELPHFPEPTTIPDMVTWELDEWERVIDRRGGEPEPLLAFALDWLRRNIPDVDGPVVLVQGDTGPGNFIYGGGRVLAVVDWELAHLGDPMDDIAWLTLRCTQTPLPALPARLREYEALVGWDVDDARVRYYQVLAETKLLVMGHRPSGAAASPAGANPDVGNGLIYGMLHRRLWFEAIASFLGLDLTGAGEGDREGRRVPAGGRPPGRPVRRRRARRHRRRPRRRAGHPGRGAPRPHRRGEDPADRRPRLPAAAVAPSHARQRTAAAGVGGAGRPPLASVALTKPSLRGCELSLAVSG